MSEDVVRDGTPVERVEALLERLNEDLDLEAEIVVDEADGQIRGALIGDELGLFIGRHGQTIDAVQHLAHRVATRGITGEERRRVEIDAAGYRGRRAASLERSADEAADEAVRFGRPVALDAMGAVERKHVHEYLRERGDVETYSEGDEPDRHLVVAPLSA